MASQNMQNKGVLLSSFNEPLQLADLPLARPSLGSAVVTVLATYVAPYAKKLYSGGMGFDLPLPMTPGLGCIGRIYEVGSDAVKLKTNDLVFVDPTVSARDDEEVVMLQGHFEGLRPEGKTLMENAWRHGALQNYITVPLENCILLNEGRLSEELSYSPAELMTLFPYMVAAGPLIETANLLPGETIVIGPASGTYSGAAVEIALALGANVVALGRSEEKFARMMRGLGHPKRLHCIALTGIQKDDVESLQEVLPNGADVYSDWSPTGSKDAIYLTTVAPLLKRKARVVLSGAASTSQGLPYGLMVLKDLSVAGKYMYSRKTVQRVFQLASLGILDVGERSGAVVRKFKLDSFSHALDTAEEHGTWRDYTIVTPNI